MVNATCKIGEKSCYESGRCHYPGECENKIVSIADHIRAMSDEELADFLWQFNDDSFENVMPFCKNTEECGEKLDSADISTEMCKRCLLGKLQQPYESPTGQKG